MPAVSLVLRERRTPSVCVGNTPFEDQSSEARGLSVQCTDWEDFHAVDEAFDTIVTQVITWRKLHGGGGYEFESMGDEFKIDFLTNDCHCSRLINCDAIAADQSTVLDSLN